MTADSHHRHLLRRFVVLALGFWRGPTRRTAWTLSLGFLACLIANMLVAVGFNQWNKFFFDALQLGDRAALRLSGVFIVSLALCSAIAAMALVQMRMRLQLKWRQWLTDALVAGWLDHRSPNATALAPAVDNPEARIADDGRIAVELFVDLAGGVINTILLSTSLVLVLWYVGGAAEIGGVTVPGYFVVAVLVYSFATSFAMYRLGRPLVRQVEEKAAREGDFRYALMRTRETSDAITTEPARHEEHRALALSFLEVADRWLRIIARQTRMAFLSSSNTLLAPTIPLFLGLPKFLSGSLTLGDLMQVAAAFLQVHAALNWLADNALSLANWSASARRVAELDMACRAQMRRLPASSNQ
jgi:putative ATP-binding cassette transporter